MGAGARVGTVYLPACWNRGPLEKRTPGSRKSESRAVNALRTPGNPVRLMQGVSLKKSSPSTSIQHNLCPSIENPKIRAVGDVYITC